MIDGSPVSSSSACTTRSPGKWCCSVRVTVFVHAPPTTHRRTMCPSQHSTGATAQMRACSSNWLSTTALTRAKSKDDECMSRLIAGLAGVIDADSTVTLALH